MLTCSLLVACSALCLANPAALPLLHEMYKLLVAMLTPVVFSAPVLFEPTLMLLVYSEDSAAVRALAFSLLVAYDIRCVVFDKR